MDKSLFRIVDANFNRSREGLRVCEEITRFILGSSNLTKRLKKVRHRISAAIESLPHSKRRLLELRDVETDVGRPSSPLERKRLDAVDVFSANIQRVKESLRVLEEFFKLIDGAKSDELKDLRFEVYAIEKSSYKKLESIRNSG